MPNSTMRPAPRGLHAGVAPRRRKPASSGMTWSAGMIRSSASGSRSRAMQSGDRRGGRGVAADRLDAGSSASVTPSARNCSATMKRCSLFATTIGGSNAARSVDPRGGLLQQRRLAVHGEELLRDRPRGRAATAACRCRRTTAPERSQLPVSLVYPSIASSPAHGSAVEGFAQLPFPVRNSAEKSPKECAGRA